MTQQIIELSEEEIQLATGAADTDGDGGPATSNDQYPIIDNNPP